MRAKIILFLMGIFVGQQILAGHWECVGRPNPNFLGSLLELQGGPAYHAKHVRGAKLPPSARPAANLIRPHASTR